MIFPGFVSVSDVWPVTFNLSERASTLRGVMEEEEESPVETGNSSSLAGEGGDVCRQNGLINTHRLGAEPQKALLLVYSAPQYHSRVLVNGPAQQERTSKGEGGAPQLLNPSTLLPHHVSPDRCLRPPPGFFLCPESVLQAWGEVGGGDCCETTFIEGPDSSSSAKETLLLTDGKFLDFCGEEAKICTLSYDIDDDDDFQELEVCFHVTEFWWMWLYAANGAPLLGTTRHLALDAVPHTSISAHTSIFIIIEVIAVIIIVIIPLFQQLQPD